MNNSVWTVFAILFWLQVKWWFLHTCCLLVNVWVFVLQTLSKNHLNHLMTKPTVWLCAQWRLKSAWASAHSDQSSLSAWRQVGTLATHWTHSEGSEMSEIEPIRGFQCYRNNTGSYLKSFPSDKTVFYGIYLTLFMFVLMQFSLSKVRTWYYNIQQTLLSDMKWTC